MNIDRFKQQHRDILGGIDRLRQLSRAGVVRNATDIAEGITSLSQLINMHLAIEDRILYPMLQDSDNATLASMGRQYQAEMSDIATPFISFARKWNNATALTHDPDGFRDDANTVLKRIHERMRREDTEFYPAIENSLPT